MIGGGLGGRNLSSSNLLRCRISLANALCLHSHSYIQEGALESLEVEHLRFSTMFA